MTHRLTSIFSCFILLTAYTAAADINNREDANRNSISKNMIFELGNKATVSLNDPNLDDRLRQMQPACPNSITIPPATDEKPAPEGRYNIGGQSIIVANKIIEYIGKINDDHNALKRRNVSEAEIYSCLVKIRDLSSLDITRFLIFVSATLRMGDTTDIQQKFFLHDPAGVLVVNLQENNNFLKVGNDEYPLPKKLPRDVNFCRDDSTGYVLDKFLMYVISENVNVAFQPQMYLGEYNDESYGFVGFINGEKILIKPSRILFAYNRLKDMVKIIDDFEKKNPKMVAHTVVIPKEIKEFGEITQDHVEMLFTAKYNSAVSKAGALFQGKRGDEYQSILTDKKNNFNIYHIADFSNMNQTNPNNAKVDERNLNELEARLVVYWIINTELYGFQLTDEDVKKGLATSPQAMFQKIYELNLPKDEDKKA